MNPEECRCVGGHQACFDDAHGEEDQRGHRASQTEVKPSVEKILLVFEKAEFGFLVDPLAADLRQLDEAKDVESHLQGEEDQEDQEGDVVDLDGVHRIAGGGKCCGCEGDAGSFGGRGDLRLVEEGWFEEEK